LNFNLHTHTNFCDGSDHPERYIEKAIDAGFHCLGFSSHAPVPFENYFAIQNKTSLAEYCFIIRELEKVYRDRIDIFLSLEIDYIPGVTERFDDLRQACGLDYVIGSIHLVKNENIDKLWFIDGPEVKKYDQGLEEIFGGEIKTAVKTYFHQLNQMIIDEKPDVIGHLDKIKMHNQGRYFNENEDWYQDLLMETIDIIKEQGSIVEINTRGLYKKRAKDLFPSGSLLKYFNELEIPMTLSSDAHKPEEINGYYDEIYPILMNAGIGELMVYTRKGWAPQSLLQINEY
jgi:histidinol-phosphatase (PHP family)